jgi:tetratricopeptide (TPR) repeat protein
MSAVPSPPKVFEPREPVSVPAASARARPVVVKLVWRRAVVLLCGVIAALLAAAIGWFEYDPPALAHANDAYRRNELEEALSIARGHLDRRPYCRAATLLVARCLSRLGRPKEGEPYYQKASPLNLEDRHIRAYALVLSNARDPAILAYQEILRLWPQDVLALRRMAAVLISESRWYDAMDAARRLTQIPSAAVIGHTLAGVVHDSTGESEEATNDFDQVMALDPELKKMPLKPRSMFWAEYGRNLILIGRTEDAKRYLHRALGEGDDPTIADLLGEAYSLQGAFEDAEQCWRLALQLEPTRHGTWWRLGKLELQRGRPAEAIDPLRRSTALRPDAVGPLYSLSLAYRRLGRNALALEYTNQANRLRARNGEPARPDAGSPLQRSDEPTPRNRENKSWRARAETTSDF